MSKDVPQLALLVRELCALLGLQNSMDNETIVPRARILENADQLCALEERFCVIGNKRGTQRRARDGITASALRHAVDAASVVVHAWHGGKFSVIRRNGKEYAVSVPYNLVTATLQTALGVGRPEATATESTTTTDEQVPGGMAPAT